MMCNNAKWKIVNNLIFFSGISPLRLEQKFLEKHNVKHRKHCVSLFREEKIKIFNNLNLITDNKNSGNMLNLFSQTKLLLTMTSC